MARHIGGTMSNLGNHETSWKPREIVRLPTPIPTPVVAVVAVVAPVGTTQESLLLPSRFFIGVVSNGPFSHSGAGFLRNYRGSFDLLPKFILSSEILKCAYIEEKSRGLFER